MTLEPLVAPREAADGSRRRLLLTSHPVLSFLTPCPPGTRIPITVRQRVFASLLGTMRESLNELLHAWEKEGLVRLKRGAVVLERPGDLADLVDS